MTSVLRRVASHTRATTHSPNCPLLSAPNASLQRPTAAPRGTQAAPPSASPCPRNSSSAGLALLLPRAAPGEALPTTTSTATTTASTTASTGTTASAPPLEESPSMADSELELAAQRVRQLEAEAIAMHDLAQRLNKEGRFEEAQAAYASMHRLEDEASQLADRVGCVACVLGDPGQGQQQEQPSLCNLDPAVLVPYQQLHPAQPWPRSQQPGTAPLAGHRDDDGDDGVAVVARQFEARARGCVVGSALADAAAMGVHWVYDLAVLDEIELERRQQAAAAAFTSTSSPTTSLSPASLEHPRDFGLDFTDPPRSPFYSYASGRNSPYGEQTLVLLRSLAEGAGGGDPAAQPSQSSSSSPPPPPPPRSGLHCGHYAELFSRTFGPESGFDGYRDVSTKGFLRNYGRGFPPPLTGAADAQANCVARLAPLLAAFGASPAAATAAASLAAVPSPSGSAPPPSAGDDLLLRCVDLATRVTQNTDAAVAWASAGAVVLERLLFGSTAEAAVRHVVHDLESPTGRLAPYVRDLRSEIAGHLARALELRATPVPDAVAALGRNCHMPNALQTPLHVVLHVEHLAEQEAVAVLGREGEGAAGGGGAPDSDPRVRSGGALPAEAYTWGLRLAVREGGCCASRAAYVGACLGAMVAAAPAVGAPGDDGGLRGLPEGWLGRYPAAPQVRAWAEAVLEARRRATAEAYGK